MRYLDLTLPGAAENLALDEALLEEAESADSVAETLRLWEPARPMVVLGRSSKIEDEVDLDACHQLKIPVLRRVSGGAAVLAGPGCLMYALVLDCRVRPALRAVGHAHQFVLSTLAAALRPLAQGVGCRGVSDLAVGEQKFSGNSIRLRRDHLLYHGTLLYDFPLELIGRCLKMPRRQPDYRTERSHHEFLTNLPLERTSICRALITAWEAQGPYTDWPRQHTALLAAEKYARREWNEQGRPAGGHQTPRRHLDP
jgi:lipoate-protein ligase A